MFLFSTFAPERAESETNPSLQVEDTGTVGTERRGEERRAKSHIKFSILRSERSGVETVEGVIFNGIEF